MLYGQFVALRVRSCSYDGHSGNHGSSQHLYCSALISRVGRGSSINDVLLACVHSRAPSFRMRVPPSSKLFDVNVISAFLRPSCFRSSPIPTFGPLWALLHRGGCSRHWPSQLRRIEDAAQLPCFQRSWFRKRWKNVGRSSGSWGWNHEAHSTPVRGRALRLRGACGIQRPSSIWAASWSAFHGRAQTSAASTKAKYIALFTWSEMGHVLLKFSPFLHRQSEVLQTTFVWRLLGFSESTQSWQRSESFSLSQKRKLLY